MVCACAGRAKDAEAAIPLSLIGVFPIVPEDIPSHRNYFFFRSESARCLHETVRDLNFRIDFPVMFAKLSGDPFD